MKPNRIAVLGGSGRVGRLLSSALKPYRATGCILVQSRVDDPSIDVVAEPHDSKLGERLAALQPGALVVFWGATPGRSNSEMRRNTDLALHALELAKAVRCQHVILMSSSAVYSGSNLSELLTEHTTLAPANAYGRSKLEMENSAQAWWNDCPTEERPALTILRMSNVIGCDMLGDAICSATSQNPLLLDRFSDGRGPRRSYLGPSFLFAAVRGIVEKGAPFSPAIYNLADNCVGFSMQGILQALDQAGKKIPWMWQPAPETAQPEIVLDTSRFETEFPELSRLGCANERALVTDFLAARPDL